MPELNLDEARLDRLNEVMAFVDAHLEEADCPMKTQLQIDVAVEEIYVNIASYAYAPETGPAVIRLEMAEDASAVTISFIDRGVPFDPLAKPDPDITLSAEERKVGGLGIFMVKKLVDDVEYRREGQFSILTIHKRP